MGDRERERAHYIDGHLFYEDYSIDNAPCQEQVEAGKDETSCVWALGAREIELDPISVVSDVPPPPAVREAFANEVLDGQASPNRLNVAAMTHFEARFNPNDAVLLADGPLMVSIHCVYWGEVRGSRHMG